MDWPSLLRAGLTGLRLTPDAFWQLTPAELLLMLGLETGAAPLNRARLTDLSRAYPDKPKEGP